jgi:hypothetical protein
MHFKYNAVFDREAGSFEAANLDIFMCGDLARIGDPIRSISLVLTAVSKTIFEK